MGQYILQAAENNNLIISIQTDDMMYFQKQTVSEDSDILPFYRTNLRVILDSRYNNDVNWECPQSKKIVIQSNDKQYIFEDVVSVTELKAGFDYQYYLILSFQSKEKVQIA